MTESDTPRPHTPRRLTSCNRGMEMYSKDGRIQRKEVLEVKAFLAAREVILKAEKHPVVKAYLKALKFVEEEEAREGRGRSPPSAEYVC